MRRCRLVPAFPGVNRGQRGACPTARHQRESGRLHRVMGCSSCPLRCRRLEALIESFAQIRLKLALREDLWAD